MNDLFMLSLHFDTGKNTTICTLGHQSQSTQTAQIFAALNWRLFKNGNLVSTFHLFANFSIQSEVFSKNLPSTPTANLVWQPFGVDPDTNSHRIWSGKSFHLLDFKTGWNCGPSSMPWGRTPRPDLNISNSFVPMMVDSPCVMPFDVSPTTSKNHSAPCRWAPSMQPSNGGKENQHRKHQLYGHRGPLHQICTESSSNFFGHGITRWLNTKYPAIFHHSKRYSSNTQQCSTSYATINRPSSTGPPTIHLCVAASPGQNTKLLPWILRRTTGFCRDPSFNPYCHHPLPWSPKAPCPTKSSHPRRSTWTNYIMAYANGPNEMAYHPCQPKTLRILETNFGKNIIGISPTISQNPPSPSFNPLLKRQSSTVKTNRLHHYEFIARVSITKPSPIPSKIRQFLKL